MYLDNKYTRYYYNIINNAKCRVKPENYTEKHHIIPKCLGGSNDMCNLVSLTAKEHFVVHHLLTKMLLGKNKSKMITAYWRMCNRKQHKINSNQYEKCKKVMSEEFKNMWDDPNSVFNSLQYRGKLSKSNKISQNKPEVRESKSLNTKLNRMDPNSVYNTQQYKEKHREIMKKFNDDTSIERSSSIARNYIVINPLGENFKINNMDKFCKENNLNKQNMCAVSKGRRKHHKGWKCYKL